MSSIKVNCNNLEISNDSKICIIAGPCQLESEQHAMDMAGKIKDITKNLVLDLFTKHPLTKLIEPVSKVKEENKGCGDKGLDLNSGWNWTPINQGWLFNSIISGNLLSGDNPEKIIRGL